MRIMDCVLILFRKKVDPVVFDAERNCVKPSWSESLKVWISVLFAVYPQCTLFPPHPQVLYKVLLWNTLGNMQTSLEHFTTIVYVKFGGQTECIVGNWNIENKILLSLELWARPGEIWNLILTDFGKFVQPRRQCAFIERFFKTKK